MTLHKWHGENERTGLCIFEMALWLSQFGCRSWPLDWTITSRGFRDFYVFILFLFNVEHKLPIQDNPRLQPLASAAQWRMPLWVFVSGWENYSHCNGMNLQSNFIMVAVSWYVSSLLTLSLFEELLLICFFGEKERKHSSLPISSVI